MDQDKQRILPSQRQNRPGTGANHKGRERIVQILETAREILINRGLAGFSLRTIANAAGMTVGNLHYYYPNKKALLDDLLDFVIQRYLTSFENARRQAGPTPEDQFIALIEFVIDDLTNRDTSNFFPELWAMANHSVEVDQRMQEFYRLARRDFDELVGLLNPSLNDTEREQVALFISASLEGLTPFIGNGKPWQNKTMEIKNIAAVSFLTLIQSIDQDAILGFIPHGEP